MVPSRRQRTSSLIGFGLALVLLSALGLRLIGVENFFDPDGRVHISDGDGEYHAHRMAQVASDPTKLPPATDRLVAYPDGWPICWPPGFDYLFGLARWVGGSWVLPLLLSVLLGALVAWAAWRLARRAGASIGAALVSATWAAASPMLIEYSRVGRLDHHVIEPLLLLLAGASVLVALGARSWRGSLWPGLWLGAALWLWPSALFALVVLLGGLLILRAERGDECAAARVAIGASLWASAALLPLLLLMAEGLTWRLDGPSLTHLSFLLVVALIGAALLRWGRTRWRAGGIVAIGAAFWLVLNRPALSLALEFGGRQGLWGYVLEQRPIFQLPWEHVGLLIGFAPVLWLLAWALVWRRGERLGRLLCYWSLLVAPIALLQLRFLPLLVALSAPLLALALDEAITIVQARGARWTLVARVALGASLLLTILPTAPYLLGWQRAYPGALTKAREAVGRLLRNAPKVAGREAVMTPIGLGNYVVHRAGRPIVASALIDSRTLPALRDALSFYTTADLAAARAILRRRRVGWVVVGRMPRRRYERYRRFLGQAAAGFELSLAHRLAYGEGVSWLRLDVRVGPYAIFRVRTEPTAR